MQFQTSLVARITNATLIFRVNKNGNLEKIYLDGNKHYNNILFVLRYV